MQPASPKLSTPTRSPAKHFEDRQLKPSSPTTIQIKHQKPSTEASLISDIEQMIDSFLRNRTDTLKRVISTQHKESKFVEEVKKTIEAEKQKSKNSGFADIEKEYKDKAEKILMIVKQEASRIDAKLVELQAENSKLKFQLSEKNIEAVDKKLKNEIYCVEQVLNELRKREKKGSENLGKIEKLIGLKGIVFDGSLDRDIEEIVGEDKSFCFEIAEQIVACGGVWDGKIKELEDEIEKRRIRYQGLDFKIKSFWKRKGEIKVDDEDFGSRQVRSDTFGNAPRIAGNGWAGMDVGVVSSTQQIHPSLQTTVQALLSQVFSELILEIESTSITSNNE